MFEIRQFWLTYSLRLEATSATTHIVVTADTLVHSWNTRAKFRDPTRLIIRVFGRQRMGVVEFGHFLLILLLPVWRFGLLLGEFTKLRKATISFVMSARLFVRMEPLGSF
jgi:hypothetical protein